MIELSHTFLCQGQAVVILLLVSDSLIYVLSDSRRWTKYHTVEPQYLEHPGLVYHD